MKGGERGRPERGGSGSGGEKAKRKETETKRNKSRWERERKKCDVSLWSESGGFFKFVSSSLSLFQRSEIGGEESDDSRWKLNWTWCWHKETSSRAESWQMDTHRNTKTHRNKHKNTHKHKSCLGSSDWNNDEAAAAYSSSIREVGGCRRIWWWS